MTTSKMANFALVMLLSMAIVESFGQNQNSNNWFTKSMDYFHYEECASQEKSDLTAKFYNCLNTKPSSSGDKGDYTQYFKSYQGYMGGGMSGGSLNPQIPDFINKYNPQNKHSASNGFQGDKKKVDKDTWPFKTCEELQEVLRCIPVLEETECLTEKEHNFFSTMKYFFQAQSGYICSNKERISEAFEKSTCNYMKNRQDIQQQCFSINAQRLSYDWNVNFEDGVMCDLMKNLKTCEESYYDACEEQIRAYVRHSWILPLQVTPCNSTLFEPMIDALSGDKRSKRSVFNNQYGFKTADGNGLKDFSPYNQDQPDDQVDSQKSNDLVEMFAGIMSQMQKSGASALRQKRSIDDFMGNFSPFGKKSSSKSSSKSSTDKDTKDDFSPMNFADYNSQMNQDWASKFNSFGGSAKSSKGTSGDKTKSKKVSPKKDDSKVSLKTKKKDDDKSSSPMGMNNKMNFDFVSKFNPFSKTKRSVFGGSDFPGMKWDKDVNDKFNPNPFTKTDDDDASDADGDADSDATNPIERNKKINFDFANKFNPFGRRRRSVFGGSDLPGMKWDKDVNDKFNPNPFTKTDDDEKATKTEVESVDSNPAQKQMSINDKFAGKFVPFSSKAKRDVEQVNSISRSKRSADPYDESNPDEIDNDDQLDSDDVEENNVSNNGTKSEDDESINEKQKEFSKKINKKFADFYKSKLFGEKSNKTDDADEEEESSPFDDLGKFVEERIKEQLKKEEAKKKKKEELKKNDDKSITLGSDKSEDKKDEKDDTDDKDDKESKKDLMKELQKFIKDQIKKEMEKEKEKEKEDEDEKEKEKEKKKKTKKDKKKEKLSEREKDELERKKEREQDKKEREKQKKEYEKEREKDELERKKEREQNEKERQKQKEEYEREHGKKSTTTSAPTTQPIVTTTLSPSSSETITTTATPVSSSESTSDSSSEQPTTLPNKDESSTDTVINTNPPATESDDVDDSSKTTKSEQEATTQASSDNLDSSTTLNDNEIA